MTLIARRAQKESDPIAQVLLFRTSLGQDHELLDSLVDYHEENLKHVDISYVESFLFCPSRVQLNLEHQLRLTIRAFHENTNLVIL